MNHKSEPCSVFVKVDGAEGLVSCLAAVTTLSSNTSKSTVNSWKESISQNDRCSVILWFGHSLVPIGVRGMVKPLVRLLHCTVPHWRVLIRGRYISHVNA